MAILGEHDAARRTKIITPNSNDMSWCLQTIAAAIAKNDLEGRAVGATHEAHIVSYCRLLPPREIAKSF
jgi:hypothetical protein